jgi:putative addiction module component (TIGR02574 family)
MATEQTQVFRDALELSDNERATLVGLLIESLENGQQLDPDVEASWAAEAERRWNEIKSGEVKTVPWEEVRSKLVNDQGCFPSRGPIGARGHSPVVSRA